MSNTELLSSEAANGTSSAGQQDAEANGTPRRRGGLSGMVLAELRQLAGELGIETGGLRKGDLIAAIKEKQGGGSTAPRTRSTAKKAQVRSEESPAKGSQPTLDSTSNEGDNASRDTAAEPNNNGSAPTRTRTRRQSGDSGGDDDNRRGNNRRRRSNGRNNAGTESGGADDQRGGGNAERKSENNRQDRDNNRQDRQDRDGNRQDRQDRDNRQDDDDEGARRGRGGRRFRDRRRNRGRGEGGEPEVREDDVLLPVAGILDVLENYAFVRTSGYLAGPNDVYVSLSLVRKYGLRRGDAIKGVIKQPREGEQQRQKFNPLVRVDSINGLEPDAAKSRSEFHKLTPLYPNERLRLETEPQNLTGRIIDLVMPVGKGQRALIVSPPKAGKTMVLQAIANAITTNNPECHLMVVLADERPEEVTDMQRSVKGEVIASTFDRPPSDHTTVAELSIERAKRLVEMGHDVVVLLDSITRLGRAYNLAAPASGRILSGGVDSTALYPPKRFLGAARNIENGGSLTIFATALVETGSTMDTVIFEEFKGTGNAELKLDRKLSDKRLFPAVDVDSSSTRKDEILLSSDELAVTHKLRRVLSALDAQQALELLQDRLRKSRTNIEFLMQVAKTTPGKDDD
ncbi:transcription termination factor Rho [Saccharopolyspora karakumensis]|uniref:Transcription termination factor Rho n=1 Tax=Saccharopolyspora karakumensis TaxID=2530386 RepID=A0A4R5C7X9_9PSEU|nr:transcription termination factor Rho [Saccharopolyspora karakumensis]TDD93154.1 transcription termination factor Rho [Saccharopolyspora karakumensis]